MKTALLDVDSISIAFGGLKAVQGLSLALPRGGLHALIGPNGAGKTTAFNLLTGVYRAQAGRITLDGRRIDTLRPHQIAAAGLARTFQNIRLFGSLSVLDNVRMAAQLRERQGLWPALLRTGAHARRERAVEDRSRRLLAIFALDDNAHEQAKNLSYGDQRRLEIVRALATQPKVLLLDEPAAGMNPQETKDLARAIQRLRDDFEQTILLIEHDMGLVMDICENITVLDHGCVIASGSPAHIQGDPKVIEAYLGEPVDGVAPGRKGGA